MTCAACGKDNRQGRKFCAECGARLIVVCPACGVENEPGEKFCGDCGGALQSSAEGARAAGGRIAEARAEYAESVETRKVISIVFADLMGSTALQERLDPESINRVMDAYYQAVRGPVEAAGGTLVQLLGDGVLCAFGIPQIAEDDALRAVRAAVGVQQAFRDFVQTQQWLTVPIGLRVAVNTGEVVVSEEHPAGIGDPLNVAARLQQEARDGEVLIGPATRRLVADAVTLERAGVFALKGRAETVTAYRVLSLERPTGVAAAAFVGRDEELAQLSAVFAAARETPATKLAVLLGSPGLGKSRLIAEVTSRLGDAAVIAAHCDAAGGPTFEPIAAALRRFLNSNGSDASDSTDLSDLGSLRPGNEGEWARITRGISALLAGSPGSPEETFFVIRRFVAALARERPVVLVIDDLQWGEPLLLDLVEHLIQWGSGVPLFVLVGARPELRDVRSSLATRGGLVSEVVTLSGLDAGAAMRLAANVIGAADLPATVAAKVLATSEGNPLFVGELVRMLVDEGAIERLGDRWVVGANLAALEMPPTIHALLAARIERLRPEERVVLERAAVVGRHFSRRAVAALLEGDESDLDARLEALRRTELIEPDTGWFLGEPVLRFHHVLIRDAAYRRLLKGTRVELHERLANWLESRVGDAAEHDETIGWHLEQAHQLLRELGPVDAKGVELGERAAKRLAAAGRGALARDDVPVAADLLGRAIDRLDADDPGRAELALDWCEALLSAGNVSTAGNAIAELARFFVAVDPDSAPPEANATAPDRLRAWHTCFSGQLTVMTAPQELDTTAAAVARAAETFVALGDPAGEAKAHFVQAQALARLGKVGACEAALDRALAAARKAGDRRRANAVLAGAPLAALWGPSPVTRASGRCLDVVRVLRITQGAPAVEAVALSCQGVLEALRGRTDAARRMIASSRKMVEELGIAQRLLEADVFAGRIDLLEGHPDEAARTLRGAYDGLRDLGLGIDAARAGALLAQALLATGDVEEAEALTRESERLAGDDLQASIAWRGVRAEALARRGDHAAAIELAQAAVTIAAKTDALLDHADARLALAAALRAAGQHREADAEERHAIDLWGAKGATLLAERARPQLTPAPAPAPVPATELPGEAAALRRAVEPNRATAMQARFERALAARDFDAVRSLSSEEFEEIDHPSGSLYAADQALASLQRLFRSRDPHYHIQPLGTLGDSLLLVHRRSSASGARSAQYDVGPYENEAIQILQVDDGGLLLRSEVFATEHLGEAIARTYERYAETRVGPERERAAAVARAAPALLNMADLDRFATVLAPDIEACDHRSVGYGALRGREASIETLGALLSLCDNFVSRVDDVLRLRPNGLVARTTNSGVERAGGGTFERNVLVMLIFGPDGLVSRWEQFDLEQEARAVARFDELLPGRAMEAPARRLPYAVTDHSERLAAAFAVRDLAALRTFFADDFVEIDHQTVTSYGVDGAIASLERLMRSRAATLELEPLAALGQSSVLSRRRIRAEASGERRFDVGPYEHEAFCVLRLRDGLFVRFEAYATNNLHQAVPRLYELHAATLPSGPARARAEAIARAVARTLITEDLRLELADWAAAFSPDVEVRDHRKVGVGVLRGKRAWTDAMRALLELSDDVVYALSDVFLLRDDAFLVECTNTGRDRASEGPFERTFLLLAVFGATGLVTRWEQFDPEQSAAARTRWDELFPPLPRLDRSSAASEDGRALPHHPTLANETGRRVRENAATRSADRFRQAMRSADIESLLALHSPECVIVHHPTGAKYSAVQMVAGFHPLFKATDLSFHDQVLATLGEALALIRRFISHQGTETKHGPIGPVEIETAVVVEVDENGLALHSEVYDTEHLGDAIACLYERRAKQLPEGPERDRAVATTHAVAAMLTDSTEYSLDDVMVPGLQAVDHRSVGTLSGPDLPARWRAASDDLIADQKFRVDDVLALSPDGLLRRTTQSGALRASGGAFESTSWALSIFGADGRQTHFEIFNVGEKETALARFDELTCARPPATRRLRENRASASLARFEAIVAARDSDGLAAALGESFALKHHASGLEYGSRGMLTTWRSLFSAEQLNFRFEVLATLDDSLSLHRHVVCAEGFAEAHLRGVGPMELEEICVGKVDGDGRVVSFDLFAPDRLGDAVACLYERYAELQLQGSQRARAAAMAASIAAMVGRLERDRFASALAANVEVVDHRLLGTWSARGAEQLLAHVESWLAVGDEHMGRENDVLALNPDGLLMRRTFSGIDRESGGPFDGEALILWRFDDDGRLIRWELFDAEKASDALARFDDRSAGPSQMQPAWTTVATAAAQRMQAAHNARDWEGFATCLAADLRYFDHRPFVQQEFDRDGYLAYIRSVHDMPTSRQEMEIIGTRGEHLVLLRVCLEVAGEDIGPSEIPSLLLIETNPRGRVVATVRFDVADLDGAYAELDARWEAGEGAEHLFATVLTQRHRAAWRSRDWGALAACYAPELVARDHRLVGWGTLHGPAEFLLTLREMVDLAPDADMRVNHAQASASARGLISEGLWTGTRDGGSFESPFIVVFEIDSDGRVRCADFYDPHHLEDAFARFHEIADSPERDRTAAIARPNAAHAAMQRWLEAYDNVARTGDWDPVRRICSPDLVFEDRRRLFLLSGGLDLMIASAGERMAIGARPQFGLIETVGERIALLRVLWSGGPEDGPFEIEYVGLFEVDAAGLISAMMLFDADDLAAARGEAQRRRTALEPATEEQHPFANAAWRAGQGIVACWRGREWERLRQMLPATFRFLDQRRNAQLNVGKDEFVEYARLLGDMGSARIESRLLATRGERLALARIFIEVAGGDVGPSEMVSLDLLETDEHGNPIALIRFDPNDLEVAYTELDTRWRASGAANAGAAALQASFDAFADRDWETYAAIQAPGFRLVDHRVLGWGTSLDNLGTLLSSQKALIELAPDARYRVYHVRCHGPAFLAVGSIVGTREGGPFENPAVFVGRSDGEHATLELEAFDPERLDQALARFEDLADPRVEIRRALLSRGTRDAILIPANNATRVIDQIRMHLAAGNAAAIRALGSDDLDYDDRQRRSLVRGGIDTWLRAMDFMFVESRGRLETTLVAAPSDRLALHHVRWHDGSDETRFEKENLRLTEVDEAGRVRAMLLFDPEDRAAASAEALARIPNQQSGGIHTALAEYLHAWNDHDLDRIRLLLPDTFVFNDRRRTGIGRVDRAGQVDALAAWFELSADVRIEPLYPAASGPHGGVYVNRWFGTNPEGGAFEALYIGVVHIVGDRLAAIELFELDDLDAALARYEELRPTS